MTGVTSMPAVTSLTPMTHHTSDPGTHRAQYPGSTKAWSYF